MNTEKKNPAATREEVGGVENPNASLKTPFNDSTLTVSNEDFIAHAFCGIGSDETPWVAGFKGDMADAGHAVWFGGGAIPIPRFIRPDHNNYISTSSFKRNADGLFRRRKDQWAALWAALHDDLGTKIPFEKLRLPPSCLIETSPGNFHGWLFLRTPERSQHRAEALINGIIAAGANDPGAGNITRYGRLPTGINGKVKYADKDGKPWTQRVHIWEPERRYSVQEIAEAYDIDLTAVARPMARRLTLKGQQAGNGYVEILDAAGLYLEGMQSMAGHRIVCPWYKGHTDEDTTGTVYFEPSEENGWRGGFKCHHGHCKGRSIIDLDFFVHRLLAGRAA